MWSIITKPFAWLMIWLYNLTGNYGCAIILFALAVNLILTPFMAKSKKSMMRSTRLQPKIQELQRRHEGNQQKLNAEMQKLYREEGVNPMSGCLWSLIPFPILIALYSVIRQPLTRMMFVSSEFVTTLQDFFVEQGLYTVPERANAYVEIVLTRLSHDHWDLVQSGLFLHDDRLEQAVGMGACPGAVSDPLHFGLPLLGFHEDQPGYQSADGPERPERRHHEEHEPHDAPDEHLDLLCHAGRHGCLLDCQLCLRHYP